MAKDPAFLFYPNDWIGGTMGMTFEEKGAYIELLMVQFNRGHMTAQMIGQTVGRLWDVIKVKFIQDADGLWYNERLELEKIKRKSFIDSRFNNPTGKNQYGHTTSNLTTHMSGRALNVNVNEDINTSERGAGENNSHKNQQNGQPDWDFEKGQFLQDSPWSEGYIRRHPNYPIERLNERRKEFIKKLQDGDDFKSLSELKKHFSNWNKPDLEKYENQNKMRLL